MPINDNDPPQPADLSSPADPHGHAALLLVESLIHGLLERSIISVDDALDIIATAQSVQIDVAEAADGHGEPMWRAKALLTAMARSLGSHSDHGPPPHRPIL